MSESPATDAAARTPLWRRLLGSRVLSVVLLVVLVGASQIERVIPQQIGDDPGEAYAEDLDYALARLLAPVLDVDAPEPDASSEPRVENVEGRLGPIEAQRWVEETRAERRLRLERLRPLLAREQHREQIDEYAELVQSLGLTSVSTAIWYRGLLILLAANVTVIVLAGGLHAAAVVVLLGLALLLGRVLLADVGAADGVLHLRPTAAGPWEQPGEPVGTSAGSFSDRRGGDERVLPRRLTLLRASASRDSALRVEFAGGSEDGEPLVHDVPLAVGTTLELGSDAGVRIEVLRTLPRALITQAGYAKSPGAPVAALRLEPMEPDPDRPGLGHWAVDGPGLERQPIRVVGGQFVFLAARTAEEDARYTAPLYAEGAGPAGFVEVLLDGEVALTLPGEAGASGRVEHRGRTWTVRVEAVTLDLRDYHLSESHLPPAEKTPLEKQIPHRDRVAAFLAFASDASGAASGPFADRAISTPGEDLWSKADVDSPLRGEGIRTRVVYQPQTELRLVQRESGGLTLVRESRGRVVGRIGIRPGHGVPGLHVMGMRWGVAEHLPEAAFEQTVREVAERTDGEFIAQAREGTDGFPGAPGAELRVTERTSDGTELVRQEWVLAPDASGSPISYVTRDESMRISLVPTGDEHIRCALELGPAGGRGEESIVIATDAPGTVGGLQVVPERYIGPAMPGGPIAILRLTAEPIRIVTPIAWALIALGSLLQLVRRRRLRSA